MESPFVYKGGELFCENVPLVEIARQFGTPCYIYSYSRIVQNYHVFDDAFSSVPHLIAYAVKANSNGAILRTLAREGSGADVVSGGELARALAAGIPPKRVVFAGVGKRQEELARAVESGILLVNIESLEELESIHVIASERKTRVRISIRVNPDVELKTHPYISTGRSEDKFGLPVPQALTAYRRAKAFPELALVGIHMHIGSQITQLSPYQKALETLLSLVEVLAEEGIYPKFLDIGGGLGISYAEQPVPSPADLAAVVLPMIRDYGGTLLIEPGRAILGDAGLLITEVLYRKPGLTQPFLIVDAGMNDLIRPCLYGAQHRVVPVVDPGGKKATVAVVGPVCESADVLTHECSLPQLKPGEYLAIKDVGAYGFSMASRYNSRPCPAEVMVKGEEAFLIREREDLGDLTARERIPPFLS